MAVEKKPAAARKTEKNPTTRATFVEGTHNSLQKRAVIEGVVVSDKMQKTIVVKVDRQIRHRAYKKYVVRSSRYKAHDEKNEARTGDRVQLVESKPISKDKRWVLRKIVRRAAQVAEVNA